MISAVGTEARLNQMNYGMFKSSGNIETMFSSLSVATGGNGKNVSKEQLSSYIKNAQQGKINISSDKLEILKDFEKKWDKLFGEKEEVSVKDIQGNSNKEQQLFADKSTNSIEFAEKKIEFYKEKNKEFQEFLEKLRSEIRAEAEEKAETQAQAKKESQAEAQAKAQIQSENNTHIIKDEPKEKGVTKNDLKKYLNTLIQKEPNDKEEEKINNNEISSITNLIAEFDEITGGKKVMTSFEKEIQYSA